MSRHTRAKREVWEWHEAMTRLAKTFGERAEQCTLEGSTVAAEVWRNAAGELRVQSTILLNKTSEDGDIRG